MSDFRKKVHAYRQGDNWRDNFKHINYANVEASLRSILTTKELGKVYNRFGIHSGSLARLVPLSLDETIFRIMVLMDTQCDKKDT